METLFERFDRLAHEETDIKAHYYDLFRLARKCSHITEIGVRNAISTTALYYGLASNIQVKHRKLVCYDITDCTSACNPFKEYSELDGIPPKFEFIKGDSLKINIEKTELLFIDSFHSGHQLGLELDRHSKQVERWIALHDTVTYGETGEDGKRGLQSAIDDFIAQSNFELMSHSDEQNGFTVLERV